MIPRQLPEIALRPFGRDDFDRLISWVGTPEALGVWCASFFSFPLDGAQLARYLESAGRPPRSTILTAVTPTGEAVGHVELSHVWPHLSSRLSRVLVAPERRRTGIGAAMVWRALALSFETHCVDRIDLGVSADNEAAIACYNRTGFEHVGTWPHAMEAGPRVIDVYWMTVTRRSWESTPTGDSGGR
jgi:RimJ/RimL family protein N-acetyltransferase